jgi:uncharacterized protein
MSRKAPSQITYIFCCYRYGDLYEIFRYIDHMPQHAFELDHNGQTLRGMSYLPQGNARFPTVLFMHGFTGNRMETGFAFVRLARKLVAQGIAAVTFDFINSGESDGSFDQMLVTQEVADAVKMTTWLQGQSYVDRSRMGVLGFSLGGLVAGCVSARTQAYKTMVLLAPTTSKNMCRHAKRDSMCDDGSVRIGPHCLNPQLFEDVMTLDAVGDCARHPGNNEIPSNLPAAPRTTLVIQGTEDQTVPPAVSGEFVDAMQKAQMPVELHLIQHADHGFSRRVWQTEMISKSSDWLAKTL